MRYIATAANVADFDGNRIEFVRKAVEPKRHHSNRKEEGGKSPFYTTDWESLIKVKAI